MGVRDLLERSGDAMKYMVIDYRLLEALRMNWQDAKFSKLLSAKYEDVQGRKPSGE